MCGIAGTIVKGGNGVPFLLNALEVLNTRGYDGYGLAMIGSSPIKVGQKQLEKLKQQTNAAGLTGSAGIAHNRWATHGKANAANAHPHGDGSITIAHNGDIDNWSELREELTGYGHEFLSDTDSEVFAVLVSHYRAEEDFFGAVKKALLRLGPTSTYAFLITDGRSPDQIIAVRKGSRPLLWATIGEATYIASEESALNGFVQSYQELPEGDIALFGAGKLLFSENMSGELYKQVKTYEIDPEHYVHPEKTSDYWMYQEMMDAPGVIKKAIGKRATIENGIVLGGLDHPEIQRRLQTVKRFFVAGCGTSYHAAQITADTLQQVAGISAEALIASEAVYKTTVFDAQQSALLVISQSGETADVVRLMNEWKPRGILMLGIVNVPNTQIPKLTDAGIYCHIGREVAVASTKAFLGQVVCGAMFALFMAQQRGLSLSSRNQFIEELLSLPFKARSILQKSSMIKDLAEKYAGYSNFLYVGRGYSAVAACEGALKLKEVSWDEGGGIHAFGIPAGEMKHGTLAMIDEQFPSIVIAPNDAVFLVTMNNASEIQARGGKIILVTTNDAKHHAISSMEIVTVPRTVDFLSPILTAIPLQLFSFYAAIARGCNPDLPRNLAKSVTVE